uniref:Uncharacterized protein n=1 Tax=Yersinia enterocolitica TaxID=630 RepID=B0RKI7_YEREN|nr:hypothetical protein [Yersinia enterocolitica]CAP20301.1 hypothetical protein [Yersinia enterocolitica]
MPCATWFLNRKILCRFRFSNALMICWNTLIALTITSLNMTGSCPAWQKRITAAND